MSTGGAGAGCSDEKGVLTVFVATLAVALFALVGLVVDGGRAVAARAAAAGVAEQAARTGAAQIAVSALRTGEIRIDPSAALSAADRYLEASGLHGVVTTAGQSVIVRITTSDPTVVLGIVGVDHISVSVTASATDLHGVARED